MKDLVVKTLLVALVTLAVGGIAYAYSDSQTRSYQASAQLEFGRLLAPDLQILGGSAPGDPQIDAAVRVATEQATVDSFDVARETARSAPQLGLTANEIAGRVTGTAVRGTLVVTITATGSTPEQANRLANFYTDAAVSLRRDRERRRAQVAVRATEARLNSLSTSDARGVVGGTLRNQLGALRVLQRVGSGSPEIIERAQVANTTSTSQTQRNTLFGLLFGLAAGLGLVALRGSAGSGSGGGPRVPGQSDAPSPSEPPVFR